MAKRRRSATPDTTPKSSRSRRSWGGSSTTTDPQEHNSSTKRRKLTKSTPEGPKPTQLDQSSEEKCMKHQSGTSRRQNEIRRSQEARVANQAGPEVTTISVSCDDGVSARHEDLDHFMKLSVEVICQILDYLPIWDVMKLECQCRHLQTAVTLHLQLLTDIDFTEGEIHGWMPTSFTDNTLKRFLARCPQLMYLYGVHLDSALLRRRQRSQDCLSVPGMIDGLQQCDNLSGVETSNIYLLEALLHYLPSVEIMGTFKNRDGTFPISPHTCISLPRNPQLTSIHLTGVELTELPRMDYLQRIYLRWVRFTSSHPFREFGMPSLRCFVMSNCAGPQNALKYVPLMTGLAAARSLSRLELIRVPFLGGLIHHVVEDSWRVAGFRNLHKIKIGACKHIQEADLGYLLVTSQSKLEELCVQPSLTKDSFFYSMTYAESDFTKLRSLSLGYVDDFPEPGKWTAEELTDQGLAEYVDNPAFITDFGMRCVARVFSHLLQLKLYNCPQVIQPSSWAAGNPAGFSHLTDIHLRRCHAIKLSDLSTFLSSLHCLESLCLEEMFKEPPKGCSRVGLSAGLGVSSALLGGQAHHPSANQNPARNPLANQNPAVNPVVNRNPPQDPVANQNPVPNLQANQNPVPNPPANQNPVPNPPANQNPVPNNSANQPQNEPHVQTLPANQIRLNRESSNQNISNTSSAASSADRQADSADEAELEDEVLVPVEYDHEVLKAEKDSPKTKGASLQRGGKMSRIPSTGEPSAMNQGVGEAMALGGESAQTVPPVVESESELVEVDVYVWNNEAEMNSDPDQEECSGSGIADVKFVDESSSSQFCEESENGDCCSMPVSPPGEGSEVVPMASSSPPGEDCEVVPMASVSPPVEDSEEVSPVSPPGDSSQINTEVFAGVDSKISLTNENSSGSGQSSGEGGSVEAHEEGRHSTDGLPTTPSIEDAEDKKIVSNIDSSNSKPNVGLDWDPDPNHVTSDTSMRITSKQSVNESEDESLISKGKRPQNRDIARQPKGKSLYGTKKGLKREKLMGATTSHEGPPSEDKSCDIMENNSNSERLSEENAGGTVSNVETPHNSEKCKTLRSVKNERNAENETEILSDVKCEDGREALCASHGHLKDVEGESKVEGQEIADKTSCEKQKPQGNGSNGEDNKSRIKSDECNVTGEIKPQVKGKTDLKVKRSEEPVHKGHGTKVKGQVESKVIGEDKSKANGQDQPEVRLQDESSLHGDDEKVKDRHKPKGATGSQKAAERRETSDGKRVKRTHSDRVKRPETDANKKVKSRADKSKRTRSNKTEQPQSDKVKLPESRQNDTETPEEDHLQTLVIKSASLLSLSLHHVGITDLVLAHCKQLSTLTVSACRVLQNVKMDSVPWLGRASFTQCPKLKNQEVVKQICQQPSEKHRLIFLRPIKNYDAVAMERHLLSSTNIRYHVCLIHDHSRDPEQTLYNRLRVANWPDVITNINYDLVKTHKQPEVTKETVVLSDRYPWRPGVYRMQGVCSEGAEWDMVSDIPWIQSLAADSDRITQSWLFSDSKAGVYSPSGKGHCGIQSAKDKLVHEIAEIQEQQRPLYMHPVIVYVNLCDINKVVPDIDLIKTHKQPEVTKETDVLSDRYPWRPGVCSEGAEWDMVSDIPWIRSLAADSDRITQSWLFSDSKAGVYSPSGKGHCGIQSAKDKLVHEIAEIQEQQRPLYMHPVIVYVNLCDINKVVPDMYA